MCVGGKLTEASVTKRKEDKFILYIRKGRDRTDFSIVFHELYDLYHGYIGDKATLYYGFLLRYRHNEEDENYGKSWNGRKGVAEKFQLSYSTLPLLDRILEIAELVEITTVPSGRGKERIVYTVHDPLTREQFRWRQPEIAEKLRKFIEEKPAAASLVGKEFRRALAKPQ